MSESHLCGVQCVVALAPLTDVELTCGLHEHAEHSSHYASDERDGVRIIFLWQTR